MKPLLDCRFAIRLEPKSRGSLETPMSFHSCKIPPVTTRRKLHFETPTLKESLRERKGNAHVCLSKNGIEKGQEKTKAEAKPEPAGAPGRRGSPHRRGADNRRNTTLRGLAAHRGRPGSCSGGFRAAGTRPPVRQAARRANCPSRTPGAALSASAFPGPVVSRSAPS